MKTYIVTAEISYVATMEVDARSEDEAVSEAEETPIEEWCVAGDQEINIVQTDVIEDEDDV